MTHLQRRARVAYVLCFAAIPAGVVSHLALTDIFHGESDLRLEWRVLQVSALIIAAALVASLLALRTVLRDARGERTPSGVTETA